MTYQPHVPGLSSSFPDYMFQTRYPTFLFGKYIHHTYIQVWYQSKCFHKTPACSHSDGSVPMPYQLLNCGPWLVWLSGWSTSLRTKRSLVRFLARAHACVVGQVPSWGHVGGNQSMYLSHIDVSLPLFLLPFPSL